MKWCIIVSEAPFLMEFLGKTVSVLTKQGDECVLLYSSKYAEYEKVRFFPAGLRAISKVDWLLKYYDSSRQEYGKLSWRVLYGNFDRVGQWPLDYGQSHRRVEQEYQFFDRVFSEECPDAVLYEPPAGVMGELARLVAHRHGIPYLGVGGARIPGRLTVHDSEYTDRRYQETFKKLRMQDITQKERKFAERFVRNFLTHRQLPSYEKVMKVRFTPLQYLRHYMRRLGEVGAPLLRYLAERGKYKRVDFESEHRLRVSLRAPFDLAFAQVRMALQKGMYRKMNAQDIFYLFPLHLQPEASTSVQAMHYSDQAETIRQTAFLLPFPAKLYVKENASAVGTKPAPFYRKIQNIPNAVLIDPTELTPELIRRCRGVITLTGTVGMEAAMAGKPAYALGDVFYEYHPLCRTPGSFKELGEQIRKDYERGVQTGDLQEQNIRFLVSYLRATIPGVVAAASSQNDSNNYPVIAQGLREVVQARKRQKR